MEKNLSNKEALQKFKKMVNDINMCMLITNQEYNHTRPMATIDVEENGTLWFFTDIRSVKVEEIHVDHSVHLIYAHPGKESYLDIWGQAAIVTDKQTIKDKWSPFVKAWFPGGAEDPNLALLKIIPEDINYWDAESGKMVSFLKIIVGAVSGKPALSSDAHGKLKV